MMLERVQMILPMRIEDAISETEEIAWREEEEGGEM
tara:strand:- start:4956 stop:5063 length:108 start_codon:yes stop_codon:yes gene_type:complete